MKGNWSKRTKKWMIASVSALMLASHLSPLTVLGEEVDNEDEIETLMQMEEEIDETEDLNTAETKSVLESDVESDEEVKENPETEVDETVEFRYFDTFSDFVHKFKELTEEEKNYHIDEFSLFADDEEQLHSSNESIQEQVETVDREQLKDLIEYLIVIREQNIAELKNNEVSFNSDLNESMIEQQIEQQSEQQQSLSMRTYNSNRSALMSVSRLQGSNRYETATSISQTGWNKADTVIVVDATQFADALAGAPLAKSLNAPILLVGNGNGTSETIREIDRLGASKVIILGGEVAVPKSFESRLNGNIKVERIAGSNRYETAKLIADRVVKLTGSNKAILVSGEDFADAMSVAPFAARDGMPIYLTRRRALSNEVKEASKTIKDWTIIGGGSAISGTTGRDLQNRVNSIQRIEGSNRYHTNQRVISHYGTSSNKAYVATGLEYMDALTGSVLAAKEGTAVVLVRNSENILESTVGFVQRNNFTNLTLFGGPVALNERVEYTLKNLELPREKPVIYIDPGHGGTDTGASYGGIHEKNLNLPTSMYLKESLERTGDYIVLMSRESETSLTLRQRSSDANAKEADILVSVHYNAMGGTQAGRARGIETFIYHPYYTTDHSYFNIQNYRISESLRLANAVHSAVISATGMPNRGVRGSNLHMVREPNMPAIIIELGFLDNPTDRSIVVQSSYQRKAAEAIERGINTYFNN